MVLITQATSEGSAKPAHPCSLTRAISSHAYACLKNEFTEDEKYYYLMRWLICFLIIISHFQNLLVHVHMIIDLSHIMRLWYFLSSINSHVQPTNGARCLIFGWTLCLLPNFMCANSTSSVEAARMRRLI